MRSFAGVARDLSFNTAVSFVTNTIWRSYAGESTMGHLVHMAGLTVPADKPVAKCGDYTGKPGQRTRRPNYRVYGFIKPFNDVNGASDGT